MFYAEYNLRLFLYLLTRKFQILHSNDLDTLLANYLASRLKRKPIVYDSHEYFTEVPELQGRAFAKKSWESIEGWIFPDLSKIFTVNESIAQLYSKKYGKELHVIRNIPLRKSTLEPEKKSSFGLKEEDFVMVVQGTGINVDRGIEEMVEAMKILPDSIHLMIIGKGDVLPQLKEMAKEFNLEHRIHFKGAMPYAEMMKITAGCDLGISLDKDTNINYRFSLPNKVFDYIRAQIPILCTDLPELSKIVKGYEIGKTVSSPEPKLLAEAVLEMQNLGKEKFTRNLVEASSKLAWEVEVLPMIKVYDQFRKGSSPT